MNNINKDINFAEVALGFSTPVEDRSYRKAIDEINKAIDDYKNLPNYNKDKSSFMHEPLSRKEVKDRYNSNNTKSEGRLGKNQIDTKTWTWKVPQKAVFIGKLGNSDVMFSPRTGMIHIYGLNDSFNEKGLQSLLSKSQLIDYVGLNKHGFENKYTTMEKARLNKWIDSALGINKFMNKGQCKDMNEFKRRATEIAKFLHDLQKME